jgi:hypothetical protein
MRTIIISDIEGDRESILPGGLRIGRSTETEVWIVHTVDPRIQHGTSSPQADSKSISPGSKLSHDEILRREKNKAHLALQKFISGEGSRLNYPLKIKLLVEEGSMKERFSEIENRNPGALLLANSVPGNSMVEDLDELLSVVKDLQTLTYFIPPNYPFSEMKTVLLFSLFDKDSYQLIREIAHWMEPFHPLIHAFGVTDPGNQLQMDRESSAWKRAVNSYFNPPMSLRTATLSGGDPLEMILQYADKRKPDILLVPRRAVRKGNSGLLSIRALKTLIEESNIPIGIY